MKEETAFFWDEHYRACGNIWAGAAEKLPRLPKGLRVLEAGCGNGKTISGMKNCGWIITGFDFSKTAASLCRKNIPSGICADIIVSDASGLPFSGCTYDAVFARHVIGHSLQNKRRIIAGEFERILKPGGYLFFSEFEKSDMRFGEGKETEEDTFAKKNGIITHFFSEEEVENLFSRLNPVSIETLKWPLKIRGKENTRAEIQAVFKKN